MVGRHHHDGVFLPGGNSAHGLLVLGGQVGPGAHGHGDPVLVFAQLLALHAVALLIGHLGQVLHGNFIVN